MPPDTCICYLAGFNPRLYCLFAICGKKSSNSKGEEEVVAVNKPLSLLLSTKQQRLIWDKTTYAGISAPYNRRNGTAMENAAFKYTNGRIRSGTQLWFI